MIRRLILLCGLLAFLISSGLLAAQSNDLLAHIGQGAGTVFVDGQIVGSGVVSA